MKHEPTPEFMAHLEWQTRTALRRELRFARPTPTASSLPGGSFLRTAAIVLVSLFAGGGVVVAAERLQESRDVRLLLERAEIELRLAERYAEATDSAFARVQAMFEAGQVSRSGLDRPRAAAEERALARDLAALDLAEIEVARRAPRNELSAPLVGGQDFVRERLELRRESAEKVRDRAGEALERARVLGQSGLAPVSEIREQELGLEVAERGLARLVQRLDLRAQFVGGAVDALECERRDRVGAARVRGAELSARLLHARAELRSVELLVRSGMASTGEATQWELTVADLEAGLELVGIELEALGVEDAAGGDER